MKFFCSLLPWLVFGAIFALSTARNVPAVLNGSLSKPMNQELSGDEESNPVGREVNNDVLLYGRDAIQLSTHRLVFAIPKNCTGIFSVCYDSFVDNNDAVCDCGANQCGFKVNGTNDVILLWKNETWRPYKLKNEEIPELSEIQINGIGTKDYDSCTPKFDGGNVINLKVNVADSGCPITMKNAKIFKPPPTTTPTPMTTEEAHVPQQTSEAGLLSWHIILIIIGAGAVIIILATVGILICYKVGLIKRKKPENVFGDHDAVLEEPQHAKPAAVVKEKIPQKSSDNNTKEEAPKSAEKVAEKPKKQQKKKKNSPTQDECFPPVKDAEILPAWEVYYNGENDPNLPVESMNVSIQKFIPKGYGSKRAKKLIAQMNKHYPQKMMRYGDEDYFENRALCCSLTKMCSIIHTLARQAYEELDMDGVTFDEQRRIIKEIDKDTRDYLKGPHCPSYIFYFAFGAEYHQFLPFKKQDLAKCSVALLWVVAMQLYLPDASRKMALEFLRKELPTIRHDYSKETREFLPYPIPMIDAAFKANPEYFKDPSKSDDSEQHRMKVMAAKGDISHPKKARSQKSLFQKVMPADRKNF